MVFGTSEGARVGAGQVVAQAVGADDGEAGWRKWLRSRAYCAGDTSRRLSDPALSFRPACSTSAAQNSARIA